MVKDEPGNFVRVDAGLMPKEFIFENVTSDLDDEQIDELLAGAASAHDRGAHSTGADRIARREGWR